MNTPEHPDYPVEDGRPARSEESLRTGEHAVLLEGYGNPEVFRRLEAFAQKDQGFIEDRPELGSARWVEFDDHKRQLHDLMDTCQARLDPDESYALYGYLGFRPDGKQVSTTTLAEELMERRHDVVTQADVGDLIRNASVKLADSEWIKAHG